MAAREARRLSTGFVPALVLLTVLSAVLGACSDEGTDGAQRSRTPAPASVSDDDYVVPPRTMKPVDLARSLAGDCSARTLNTSGLSHRSAVELSTFSEDTLDPRNALLTSRDRKILVSRAFRSRFLACFTVAYEPTPRAVRSCVRRSPPSVFTRASVAKVCHATWTVLLSTGGTFLRSY